MKNQILHLLLVINRLTAPSDCRAPGAGFWWENSVVSLLWLQAPRRVVSVFNTVAVAFSSPQWLICHVSSSGSFEQIQLNLDSSPGLNTFV